jgi:hypothetical protein
MRSFFSERLRGCVTAGRGIDCRDPDLLIGAADEIDRQAEVIRRAKLLATCESLSIDGYRNALKQIRIETESLQ